MAQYDGSIRINTEINTKNATSQMMSLKNQIVKTADKIAALRSKMDGLKSTQIPTQEYKDIKQSIDDTFDKLNEVYDEHFTPFLILLQVDYLIRLENSWNFGMELYSQFWMNGRKCLTSFGKSISNQCLINLFLY